MKEAIDLAKRHRSERFESGPLTADELSDLDEMQLLEVLNAKSRLGEAQKHEFAQAYEATLHPPPSDEADHDEHAERTPKPLACPQCKSVDLSANKAGFGLGKAVVGGVLIGGVGLLGGFLGANKVRVTCLACGHSWQAGQA